MKTLGVILAEWLVKTANEHEDERMREFAKEQLKKLKEKNNGKT